MEIKYPLIEPSFDPPKGKTKDAILKLLDIKRDGKNEGADELLALAELLSLEDGLNVINYAPVQTTAVHKLNQEFLGYLGSFKAISNPIAKKMGKIPLAATCVHSATSGIAAVLMANGINSGEVVTTSLNFMGVPNAIMLSGATPKFVDIRPDDLCMDFGSLEKVLSKNTKAIVLVHFNQVVDLAPLDDILKKRGLDIPVIQDASLAMGSTCSGMPVGLVNLGKDGATVYSFATSKIISGLGGAIVVANDPKLVGRVQSIAYQGWNFANLDELPSFGANFKMNDMNAAIVLEQLKKRGTIFKKRRLVRSWYDKELADVVDSGKIRLQKVSSEGVITHYAILLPDRKAVAKKMAERGIMLGFWHTAHLQKIYQDRFGTKAGMLSVTESVADRIAFLPFHTKLTEKDVSFICNALKKI